MRYFLGIDGGGTRTTAWLMDQRERILARAVSGPSNPLKAGFTEAEKHLAGAAASALKPISGAGRVVDCVCAGLAGADRGIVHRRMLAALRRAISARRHLLTTDAAITLEAALGARPGIVVISGTGSIAFGRDRSGKLLRCGGWGCVFSDEGSGYDLGRKAVMAALRDFDGRGPRTPLTRGLVRALKLNAITDVAASPPAPRELAALFPVILKRAQTGDKVAKALCNQAAEDLAALALALIRRCDPAEGPVSVVCAGGVFYAGGAIRRRFADRLHREAPGARVSLLKRQPVEGALRLARAAK